MDEFQLGNTKYRLAKIDALTQFHIVRRIMPLMGAMGGDGDAKVKLFQAIGQLSDADTEYVLSKALSDCRRLNGDNWAKIYVDGRLMFEDIGMMGMLQLSFATLKDALADFFTVLRSASLPLES